MTNVIQRCFNCWRSCNDCQDYWKSLAKNEQENTGHTQGRTALIFLDNGLQDSRTAESNLSAYITAYSAWFRAEKSGIVVVCNPGEIQMYPRTMTVTPLFWLCYLTHCCQDLSGQRLSNQFQTTTSGPVPAIDFQPKLS